MGYKGAMTLETGRLNLKPLTPEDFEAAHSWTDTIDRVHVLDPSFPLIGHNGIPIHHEIEFTMDLRETAKERRLSQT